MFKIWMNNPSDILAEILRSHKDFYDIKINEKNWVIAKFNMVEKKVAFNFGEASDEEFKIQNKTKTLVIIEYKNNGNKTMRFVRGNDAQECLNKYFEIINYIPA